MNEIRVEHLYKLKYTANVLNAIKQKWIKNDTYNFIGNKKKQHLFLCLLNCSAVYTLKDGSKIYAPQNSIVYTPEESEYEVRFIECDTYAEYNCISINFKLYDENNMPFCLDNNIKIYSLKHSSKIIQIFHEIADNYQYAIHSPMRIIGLFYILLSDIGSYYHIKNNILPKYNVIVKGINALEGKSINDVKIGDLAKMCNVSPVYFRKLFKGYSNSTPMDYKLNMMISQAKQYLVYSNKSVSEIADILGFSSHTYFCRIFKKKTGLTPTQYIKNEIEGKSYD